MTETTKRRGHKPGLDRGRVEEMRELYRAGATLQEIGDKYGLTRERVRQLIPAEAKRRAKLHAEQAAYEQQGRRLFRGIATAVSAGHGTLTGYRNLGLGRSGDVCRCERCQAANNGRFRDYQRDRRGGLKIVRRDSVVLRTSHIVCWCPYCKRRDLDKIIDRTDSVFVACELCGEVSMNPRYIQEEA